jgi:hypothetical protein
MPIGSLTSRVVGKVGRFAYRHKNSEPFLSGDLFASKSDLEVPSDFRTSKQLFNRIRESHVIFCNGYQATDFLKLFGNALSGKILIVGNSDKDWHDFPITLAPRIKAVLLQNSFVHDSRILTLPIGIENLSYFRNGRMRNFKKSIITAEKLDKVLVGPFSPTHESRRLLMNHLMESPRIEIISNQTLEPYQYAKVSSKFGYIASPRGNGEDTHRTWESLYRGSSPVLLRNEWSESLSSLGLPISFVENWSSQSLVALKPFEPFEPNRIETLWWPYWRAKIRSLT